MSPEVINKSQYGLYTDLWSFGTILYEMATGKKMFTGNIIELSENIQHYDRRKYPFPQSIDDDLKDLIMQLTNKNPMERIGLKRIEAIMSHPFFNGVDF